MFNSNVRDLSNKKFDIVCKQKNLDIAPASFWFKRNTSHFQFSLLKSSNESVHHLKGCIYFLFGFQSDCFSSLIDHFEIQTFFVFRGHLYNSPVAAQTRPTWVLHVYKIHRQILIFLLHRNNWRAVQAETSSTCLKRCPSKFLPWHCQQSK